MQEVFSRSCEPRIGGVGLTDRSLMANDATEGFHAVRRSGGGAKPGRIQQPGASGCVSATPQPLAEVGTGAELWIKGIRNQSHGGTPPMPAIGPRVHLAHRQGTVSCAVRAAKMDSGRSTSQVTQVSLRSGNHR